MKVNPDKRYHTDSPQRIEFGTWIDSKSYPGTRYWVYKIDGRWLCGCAANNYGAECSHIKLALKMVNEGDKCFYCGKSAYAAGGLEEHHVLRRSTHIELIDDPDNLMKLCHKDHERATADNEFESQLIEIWKIRKSNLKVQ